MENDIKARFVTAPAKRSCSELKVKLKNLGRLILVANVGSGIGKDAIPTDIDWADLGTRISFSA